MSAASPVSPVAPDNRADLLAIAVAAALEAGDLLASREGRVAVAATKSSPTDVVTEMDGRAEELIRARILAARPNDAILGEEGGQVDGAADAPARWVVDPLDGTVNYLYGLHDWAVSIAVEVDGEIVAGAVYVPMRGELFTAVRGEGAWLESSGGSSVPARDEGDSAERGDGESLASLVASGPPGGEPEATSEPDIPEDSIFGRVRLQCGPGVPLDRALVATGFGYTAERRTVQGEVVAALLPLIRDIRRNGAASVDLCAVAANRVDAYYERGLNYWDYAAGALIAAEAGAVVGDTRGGPPSTSMTVVAGPALFGPLSDALAALEAERDA
jgi:myo-inositol-1(or 4)-monophosphatase